MNDIQKVWNKAPIPVKLAVYGLAAWLVYRNGRRLLDKIKLRQRLQTYQAGNVAVNYTLPTGQTVTQPINLASVAGEVNDALFNNDWFGATEDEARAVNAVKTVPAPYIGQLEATYLQLYSKDLRADLLQYLGTDEWNSISYLFV
jgi:hypothetical protein